MVRFNHVALISTRAALANSNGEVVDQIVSQVEPAVSIKSESSALSLSGEESKGEEERASIMQAKPGQPAPDEDKVFPITDINILKQFIKNLPSAKYTTRVSQFRKMGVYTQHAIGSSYRFTMYGHAWEIGLDKTRDLIPRSPEFLVDFSKRYKGQWGEVRAAKFLYNFAGSGSKMVIATWSDEIYRDPYHTTMAIMIGMLLYYERRDKTVGEKDHIPGFMERRSSKQDEASRRLSSGGSSQSKPDSFPGSLYGSPSGSRGKGRGRPKSFVTNLLCNNKIAFNTEPPMLMGASWLAKRCDFREPSPRLSEKTQGKDQCLDDAKQSGRQLVVTCLDLRNAFGSAPHAALLHLLKLHGVHPDLTNIIQDAFAGGSTTIATGSGDTRPVPIASGVKQGDPLSPVVFNLLIEALLLTIQRLSDEHGYQLHDITIPVLAYADDLVLLAQSPASMQHLLDAVGRAASWVGLQFNAAKCATLHVVKKKANLDTVTSIQQQVIPTLGDSDANHLGVPTGLRIDQTPEATIKAMLGDVRAAERSLLSDWQKLYAIRTFVVPQVQFSLLTSKIKKEAFSELDREIKRVAKAAMHLPQRASAEPVFLPPHKGGANLLPLGDLADVGAIVHAFKVLTCPDPVVKLVAERSVKRFASRLLGHDPSDAELAAVLSGDPTPKGVHNASSVWSRFLAKKWKPTS
ncbi:Retrovirus-related Pol polyprotein from type-2 retrotransposable element R2DM [Frankliniella fusca]|uniref:Retrovirus-related Pol polyprotein from type-2 retrotransposable element R2DM n=1 Tax=Frankliniella fusca TaxID=407009 RepID=A0AAE1GYY0_9NEOP|nr:Retrovirus-related Pol polyprotein from type-2 retrotransposable element R2DM [Frankliniella fusca]